MDEAFIGSIVLFAGNFAPRGWAFCDGSILSINQNTALYAILGITYGGDGTTTFALPDLRSRVPVHANNGQAGPGLPAVALGQRDGNSSVTLTTGNLPAHTHQLMVTKTAGTTANPVGGVLATGNFDDPGSGSNVAVSSFSNVVDSAASSQAIGMTGNSQPLSVMPPYLGLNYIICLQGIFPVRG